MGGQTSNGRMRLLAAALTDVGRQRRHNEDHILLKPHLGLYVVADGMGGHNAGNVASALTTTSLNNFFEATQHGGDLPGKPSEEDPGLPYDARRLVAAIRKANRDVFEISTTVQQHHGMGSTVVAAYVSTETGQIHIAHVGDSRCYQIRRGVIRQLTADHSLVNDALTLKPDLTQDELARLPRNIITRALGMREAIPVDIATGDLEPGDIYLLCSDGLSGMITDPHILEVISFTDDVVEACDLLIAMANEAGGTDNVSAVLVRVQDASEDRPAQTVTLEEADTVVPSLAVALASGPVARVAPLADAEAQPLDAAGDLTTAEAADFALVDTPAFVAAPEAASAHDAAALDASDSVEIAVPDGAEAEAAEVTLRNIERAPAAATADLTLRDAEEASEIEIPSTGPHHAEEASEAAGPEAGEASAALAHREGEAGGARAALAHREAEEASAALALREAEEARAARARREAEEASAALALREAEEARAALERPEAEEAHAAAAWDIDEASDDEAIPLVSTRGKRPEIAVLDAARPPLAEAGEVAAISATEIALLAEVARILSEPPARLDDRAEPDAARPTPVPVPIPMAYCGRCGFELFVGNAFCVECGAPVDGPRAASRA